MDGIRTWIEAEGSGHWFFVAFPVVLICLLIWFKGRRVRFLIPSLIISIVIINPWFYRAWDNLGLYAYWRILWIVPVVPVVAGLVPSLTERIEKTWVKSIVAVAGVGMVMLGGTFIYNGAGGSFVEAANATKLPDYVVQIADRLLELDVHPRIIAQEPLGVYLRQYSGQIDSLYGRDLSGYIIAPNSIARTVQNELNNGEVKSIAQYMLDECFDYLIYNGYAGEDFELVDSVSGFGIYKAMGIPRVINERNELGQVLSTTTVDENCKLINNSIGYSTIHREYDSYNNVTLEWRTNSDGELVEYPGGHTYIYQQWKGYGKLLSRSYLDEDRDMMTRNDGYAKVSWTTDQTGTESIHFYSIDGEEKKIDRLNLAKDIEVGSDGWSDWMTPEPNTENYCFSIGTTNLGIKNQTDSYTITVAIEFKDVKAGAGFLFAAQGATDGKWNIGNVWDGSLVWLYDAPTDGIYQYSCVRELSEAMAKVSTFELGFRCDNWTSGSFRVRDLKIEKGTKVTKWSPGV